jgi:RND family efflux transporter MFP subunit
MLGKSLIRLQDSQINPNTGTLTVRALWPNPDHQWVAGQTLRVRLPAQQFKQAISVPLVAVQQGLSDNFVMVVEQGKVKRTSVTLQGQTDELAIVTGLAAGQTVVVDGLSRLKDGAQVKIESQATSPQGDRL